MAELGEKHPAFMLKIVELGDKSPRDISKMVEFGDSFYLGFRLLRLMPMDHHHQEDLVEEIT
jgi:hypothetical protein